MTTTGASERRGIQQLQTQGSNWSHPPLDIFELIIVRLRGLDRFRIRAVCKSWSVLNRHVSTIHELPWAFKFHWWKAKDYSECQLVDPLSGKYVVEGKECLDAIGARPCASLYGWLLLQFWEGQQKSLLMYSPFTAELIQLPRLRECPGISMKATFSLNATSPKCIIFVLWIEEGKIYVNLCSPCDYSWKSFMFDYDFRGIQYAAVDATYADGFFYCVFDQGQLGAFNVEREEWTILVNQPLAGEEYDIKSAKLIASDKGELRLLSRSESLKLLKFDFLKKRWVVDNDYLNNHVLFIGCTSFSTPAVGDASQLANTIFASPSEYDHPRVRFYGNTSSIQPPLYLNYVALTRWKPNYDMDWIEIPSGGIWKANDLIHSN